MRSGLNIAFFGSSLVSAYWNSGATYYQGLVRALHERGHSITFYEPRILGRHEHRDMPDPDWAHVEIYPANNEDGPSRALAMAQHADIVIKASRIGAWDEFLEADVPLLKTEKTSVIFWDTDAPTTLERMEHNPNDPFIRHLPHYDLVVTYGGGYPVVKAYREFGARDCLPIYNAHDPLTHRPVEPQARFHTDLSFVGNRVPDRESRVEEFLFGAAEHAPTKTFLLGGSGWQNKPLPLNVGYLGHVPISDHNSLYCSSRAVLNISREGAARNGYCPSSRIFEAAGTGACVITDSWDGIELFLEPEEEILVAHSGLEVAQLLAHLDPERARAIGAAARRRVLAHHTYAHRAQQFEEAVEAQRAQEVAWT